jgi:hypothetical protein
MIQKEDMMPILLEACPSFRSTWQEFLKEWSDEPGELPYYLAISDFARHLIGKLERNETERFPEVFDAVERLLRQGDKYTKDAMTVGLLEDLQNENLHSGTTKPEQFRKFLRPVSDEKWKAVYFFWNRKCLDAPDN